MQLPGTSLAGRRRVLASGIRLAAGGIAGVLLTSCGRSPGSSSSPQASERRVVLYTSTDGPLLPPILDRFMDETGIRVDVVSDTEATKTTGLADRLVSERKSPRADVWWSNEATSTLLLARMGLFEPGVFVRKATGGAANVAGSVEIPNDWPAAWRGAAGEWVGFALRARVIAYNTSRIPAAEAPKEFGDLLDTKHRGRIGMARPQFGTTRSLVAALVASVGPARARDLLLALKANGVKLYHGNSAVVRAIANAEVDLGLTDTDDAIAATREGWPVAFVFERRTPEGMDALNHAAATEASPTLAGGEKPPVRREAVELRTGLGALVIPNTVAVLNHAPHPEAARQLAAFLISAETEELLAQSDSRNVPVRTSLQAPAELGGFPRKEADGREGLSMAVTPEQVADAIADADRLIAEIFPLE